MKAFRLTAAGLLAAMLLTGCAASQTGDAAATTAQSPATEPQDTYIWQPVETEPPVEPSPEANVDLGVLYAHFASVCTSADRAAYILLTDAVTERQTVCAMEEREYRRVEGFVRHSFLGPLVSGMNYDAEAGQVDIGYTLDAQAHADAIRRLRERCALCLTRAGLTEDMTEAETVLALYREVTSNMTYAYGEEVPLVLSEDGLTEGAMRDLLVLLLLSEGIDALPVKGSNALWLAVGIGGEWYHFLPSFEIMENMGNFLWYFGMTDAELTEMGFGTATLTVPSFWQTYDPEAAAEPDADETADGTEEPPPPDPAGSETEQDPGLEPEPEPDPAEQDRAYTFVLTCADGRFLPLRGWDGYTLSDHVLHGCHRVTGEQQSISLS